MAKKKKKSEAELSTENELLKLKMMAEFGGNFHGSESIPPDIENAFLKQINKFHSAHSSAPLISIYEMIGKPEYNHVHDVSDRNLKKELKVLLRLLKKKGIGVETLSGVEEREIYRFITEEIFKQEMQDLKLRNWITQFVYEDFHPNDDFDIKQLGRQIALLFFEVDFIPPDFLFAENLKNYLGLSIELEELLGEAEAFKKSYSKLIAEETIFEAPVFSDKDHAKVLMSVNYRAQILKGRAYKSFQAKIDFAVVREAETGLWLVQQVSFNP